MSSKGLPITQQPGAGESWMMGVSAIPGCPPGLEYLTTIDQLFVKQKREWLEVFTGFESNNRFAIKNAQGEMVFWAAEDTDTCTRVCLGAARPMNINILDSTGKQVIHCERPCTCCLSEIEVTSPAIGVLGRIKENWSFFTPSLDVLNSSGQTVLKIEGPCMTFSCGGNVDFKIKTLGGQEVGRISKQWSGLAREMFTDADFFGISFPMDLDVGMKGVMLGACILIDAIYFEH